jgi:hypothetical protein
MKTKIISCHRADSKPVKQEVNGLVILTRLVFPEWSVTNVSIKDHVSQMSVTQMCFDQKTRHIFSIFIIPIFVARWVGYSCGVYYKTITIVIMTIISDATICSITYGRN